MRSEGNEGERERALHSGLYEQDGKDMGRGWGSTRSSTCTSEGGSGCGRDARKGKGGGREREEEVEARTDSDMGYSLLVTYTHLRRIAHSV